MRLWPVIWALTAGIALAEPGFNRLEGHGGPVKAIAVSPDGQRALTASFDTSVGLWTLPEARLGAWLDGHDAGVNAVAFLPDGRRALSAGDDFAMLLWDAETGRLIRRFEGHKGKIVTVRPSPDGSMAVTAGWDGWAGLWPLGGGPVRWLKGHRSGVNDAVFSGDGRTIYTASSDGTIRLWDTETATEKRIAVRHGFGINRLELNEKAGWLAYGAVDGAVRAIDLGTGAALADLTADRRPILALAQTGDGTRLAVGDGEGYVMIVDAVRWQIERDFHAARRGPVWALAWTADGRRVLSGGLDDAAALWPVSAADDAVAGLLTTGTRSFLVDPDTLPNGERQFARKCSICHTLTPDGARRAGPTLWGLFGRRAGSVPGYRYSAELARGEIVWSARTIDLLFDEGPEHCTPGSKMPMQRIASPDDRRDLIDFLARNTGPPTRTTD